MQTPSGGTKNVGAAATGTTNRSAAPVFRVIGLLLLVLGVIGLGAAVLSVLIGRADSFFMALGSGIGCLFWSALMYAIAEALVRLAEISAAVRKQAGE
ncbi:hypothetical protein OKA05_27195 [Luteolibacter arcticus]|uniref:Uncharacterized protein n=1 Tax=Luteolibacter arcticus TaxID=1581411 RepID=A0ABT3GS13_9BACT|nr:hypothetical protein [Luteolibacter arcticus]MCW1926270.1 hypothetical protein [Luteolibacter arcticus]